MNTMNILISHNDNNLNQSDNITESLIEECISGTHYDIANLMYHKYSHEYVSAGKIKSKMWFHFDGHIWRRTELGPYKEISTVLLRIFKQHIEKLTPITDDLNMVDKVTKLNRIVSSLKNVKVKESICRECLYLFYDPDFLIRLDRQQNLIAFRNGVFDLETKTFRGGQKDDYISLYIDSVYDGDSDTLYEQIARFNAFRANVLRGRPQQYVFLDDGTFQVPLDNVHSVVPLLLEQ